MENDTTDEPLAPEEALRCFARGPHTGVFVNGSCSGNPGTGGWGVVWVEANEILKEKNGIDSSTTTNMKMELAALIAAYKMLPKNSQIIIYSNNKTCVDTVNEWAAIWEKRGWRRKSGPVANLKLVQELYALSNTHTGVTLQWIKAHDGSRWIGYADALGFGYPARA